MLRIANLQLLFILTTLLLVSCNPYGTKGGSQTKDSPEPENEFDIGSGVEGVDQEKRPYEKGNDHLGNKEIKFVNKQQDLENNDHLGSHGLGVGIVPQGTKSITGKDKSYVGTETSQSGKDIPYADNDSSGSGVKDSTDKGTSYVGKDFIPKEKEPTHKGSSYGGKDLIPNEKEPTDKGSSYGGKDFIPKEKEPTDKDSSYGGKDFIPNEKEPTDKGSSYGGKDFIPKEKDGFDNPFPYDGKYSIHKDQIPINGGVDKNLNNGGKDSSYGFNNVGNNGGRVDVTNSHGKDKDVDNPFQEKNHVFHDDPKDLGNPKYPERGNDYPKLYPEVKDRPHSDESSEEDPGFFDNFGTILQGLKDKIKSIGHKAKKKARSTLGHLKESHTEPKENSHDYWTKFYNFWGNVDRFVDRGSHYLSRGFSDIYNEAKGSQLMTKLTQRLVEGDKVVDQFFKKVGEKVSKWLQQHGHDNVDEGLFAQGKEVVEQFSNPQFPNLFQDIEIHQELDRLVQNGIMQQEEVDQLSQLPNVHNHDKKNVKGVKY